MTLTPLDAYALRRLLVGLPLNGEPVGVSEAFRPLAERLTATPAGDRQRVWEEFLADRTDRDHLNTALAGVDPHGPTPEVSPGGNGSDPPSGGEPPQPQAGASVWPRLRKGRLVRALDKNNY